MMVVVNPWRVDHERWEARPHADPTVAASPQQYLASLYVPGEADLALCWLACGREVMAWYDPVEPRVWRDFKTGELLETVLRWAYYWPVVHLAIDASLERRV